MPAQFASLPEPPYDAVIFSAQRTLEDQEGDQATAARMVERAGGFGAGRG